MKSKILVGSIIVVLLIGVSYWLVQSIAVDTRAKVATPEYTGTQAEFENEILQRTNEWRVQNGKKELIRLTVLDALAGGKLEDILTKGYWSHYNPDGDVLWGKDELKIQGYKAELLGENLSKNTTSPEQTVEAWKNSRLHNRNLLYEKFQYIGIKCKKIEKWYCVQRFLQS